MKSVQYDSRFVKHPTLVPEAGASAPHFLLAEAPPVAHPVVDGPVREVGEVQFQETDLVGGEELVRP